MGKYSHLKFDWVGEILAIRGYGLQARRILKPLIEGGADVKIIQDEDYVPPERRITDPWWIEQIELSKKKPDSPIRICYSLPNLYKPRQGAINIGYTMWETNAYPREWIGLINQMNRFWVGTPSLAASATNGGVKVPIDVVCATIDLKEWSPDGAITKITEIPDNVVKFMFVGDWIPRKNYADLITAYTAAFAGVKDTALIIKTWSNQPGIEGRKHIENGLRHFSDKLKGLDKPRVYLLTDMIDEKALIPLMRSMDVYTSASHGEGFDLPMCQAMALGKIVVTTNYLAHGDYMTDENSIPVKFTMAPIVDAAAPLYESYQMWSNPDMGDYIEKLRLAYNIVKSKQPVSIGLNARHTVDELFSEDNNTPKIAQIIQDAAPKVATKVKLMDLIKDLA